MKTIKYILYALTATFVLASCSDDIKYTPGEGEDTDCYGVYFPSQENAGDQELDPAEPTTLTFTAMRKNYNDAITVPVEVSSTQDGLFTVSEIKFEAGQEATTFSVDFPGAEVGKTYNCSIVVKDKKYALLYGEYSNGLDFSVTRVQWDLVKGPNGETKGTWRDDFFTAIMGSNIKENGVPNAEKEVEIYERADMKGYYRIKDIYDEAYMAKIVGVRYSNVPSVPTYTIIDARDPEKVWFPVQPTGFEINDVGYEDNGAFVIVSFCQENYPGMASATMYGTLENGVLTFPPKADPSDDTFAMGSDQPLQGQYRNDPPVVPGCGKPRLLGSLREVGARRRQGRHHGYARQRRRQGEICLLRGCAQRVARCGQIGRHRRRDDPERRDHGFGYDHRRHGEDRHLHHRRQFL